MHPLASPSIGFERSRRVLFNSVSQSLNLLQIQIQMREPAPDSIQISGTCANLNSNP
jgi:hypothetical protein